MHNSLTHISTNTCFFNGLLYTCISAGRESAFYTHGFKSNFHFLLTTGTFPVNSRHVEQALLIQFSNQGLFLLYNSLSHVRLATNSPLRDSTSSQRCVFCLYNIKTLSNTYMPYIYILRFWMTKFIAFSISLFHSNFLIFSQAFDNVCHVSVSSLSLTWYHCPF